MQVSDVLNLLSKFTFTRLINIFQIYSSYHFSRFTKRVYQSGMPVSLSIEPTTSCNLRCPQCPSGLRSFTRPTGMLQFELFKTAIDQLQKRLVYLTFYFQGEPFLNPQFLEMVKYAATKKIYTATSTNAHFLSDEIARQTVQSGLDRLIISVDGTRQEVYENYRVGGKLEKVIEGTRNLLKWKKQLKSSTPHVVFQFLVVRPNEHQIEEARKLAEQLQVNDIHFKTAQIYNYEKGSDLIPTIEKYSRYKRNSDGTWSIKNKLKNSCWKMWHSSVITWDGKVLPCCFDKDAHFKLGDLSYTTFRSIWKGKAYGNFRKALFKGRKEISICKNCTEGLAVNSYQ